MEYSSVSDAQDDLAAQAEKRGYSRGYAAGKRMADRTRSAESRKRAENRMWTQIFCSALQGTLVNGKWKTGDKYWSSAGDYVRGCGNIADLAMKQNGWRA
jgi:hypothetical protein